MEQFYGSSSLKRGMALISEKLGVHIAFFPRLIGTFSITSSIQKIKSQLYAKPFSLDIYRLLVSTPNLSLCFYFPSKLNTLGFLWNIWMYEIAPE